MVRKRVWEVCAVVVFLLAVVGVVGESFYHQHLNDQLLATLGRGDLAPVAALLQSGADANAVDGSGKMALMLAVRSGDVGCVHTMISAGADVTAKDREGKTALNVADGEIAKWQRQVAVARARPPADIQRAFRNPAPTPSQKRLLRELLERKLALSPPANPHLAIARILKQHGAAK